MAKKMMNVLVLGASGSGKSTLIKAISGAKIITGVGEGQTTKITPYESKSWCMRFIDTKGFEYNFFKQRETIKQIKKYTSEQIDDDIKESDDPGIDAVWYCVEGTSRRMFENNIELMNKAIKGWKNVPIFAVITKSYGKKDIDENVQAVARSFAQSKNLNLQKIIPVVAESYQVDEDYTINPFGISELCEATLDCCDTAKEINKENRARMVLEQKRYTANLVNLVSTASAVTVGAIPLNFADAAILVPLETTLTKAILKIYGVKLSGDLITAIVGSAAITEIAKAAVEPLRALPIAGSIVNGGVAGAIVFVLGEADIAASESIYLGKLDPNKIDEVVNFIETKIKESEVLGALINFFKENTDSLKELDVKDVLNDLQEVFKNAANVVKQ